MLSSLLRRLVALPQHTTVTHTTAETTTVTVPPMLTAWERTLLGEELRHGV